MLLTLQVWNEQRLVEEEAEVSATLVMLRVSANLNTLSSAVSK